MSSAASVRALVILGRCVRAPFRALVRARDMYVRGMTACAAGRGMVVVPRSHTHGFYRGPPEVDADVRDLIRAAARAGGPPRSHSVGIGRIDEDRPCEFATLGPRSRSCAVGYTARTARRVVAAA